MEFVKKLVGEKTYLTPLVPEHASLWYRWHNGLGVGTPGGGARVPFAWLRGGVSGDDRDVPEAELAPVLDRGARAG